MIPVKKKDGTIVKISYDEFRRNYAGKIKAKKVVVSPKVVTTQAPVPASTPAISVPASVSTTVAQESSIPAPTPIAQTPVTAPISAPVPIAQATIPAPAHTTTVSTPEPLVLEASALTPPVIVQESQSSVDEDIIPSIIKISQSLSTTTPNKDFFVDEAVSSIKKSPTNMQDWDESDHVSPLEYDIHENETSNKTASSLPNKRDEALDEIVNKINFNLNEELYPRLKSLIQSRLKEIRNNDQVIDYAQRPKEQGGLGLDKDKANELLKQILKTLHLENSLKNSDDSSTMPLPKFQNARPNKNSIASLNLADSPAIPKIRTIDVPELPKATPLISSTPPKSSKPTVSDIKITVPNKLAGLVQNSTDFNQLGKDKASGDHLLNSNGGQDYISSSVGPIEEMKMFSITDLHRLGATPKEMQEAVMQKFDILKQDSFLLYLDAVKAWFSSSLYRQYQNIIQECINVGDSLENIIEQNKNVSKISMDDFMSIVEINKHLT